MFKRITMYIYAPEPSRKARNSVPGHFLPFLRLSERFMTVSKLFWSYKGRQAIETYMQTLGNGEPSGKFEPKRSNALQIVVEHVHGTFTFMLQK
jgi:hypothetical protein